MTQPSDSGALSGLRGLVPSSDKGKNRRFPSRSDEEVLEEMDVRLDYRIGWPKPLPVLPLQLTAVNDESKFLPNSEAVRTYIRDVLDAQRIDRAAYHFVLAYRHRFEVPPTDDKDLTIVIPCRRLEGSWLHALKDIRKYLSQKTIHYRIEFIDFEAANPRILNILPNHPILKLWDDHHRAKVHSIIEGTCWQSLNLFHCGLAETREECPVTIIISAWDADNDFWWDKIIPDIKSACTLNVWLLQAQNLESMVRDVHASSRCLAINAFRGPIEMGSSLGMRGEDGGGTIGCGLELKWPDGTTSELGLTNHHVVEESRLKAGKNKHCR